MTKRYKLIANRLDSPWGRAKFGVAPRHPIVEDGEVVGFKSGKIPAGMTFTWYGNPESPPAWASPVCFRGREAYIGYYGNLLDEGKGGKPLSAPRRMRYQEVLDYARNLDVDEVVEEVKPKKTRKPSQKAIDRAVNGEVLREEKPAVEKTEGGVEKAESGVSKGKAAVDKPETTASK